MSAHTGDEIRVNDRLSIARSSLDYRYATSGGPGGQHANRNRTKVEITFDIKNSTELSPPDRARAMSALGSQLSVSAQDSRSQFRNRAIAERRLAEALAEAIKPPRPRTATRPTRASKRRRLDSKKRRGELKRSRRSPRADD